MLRKCAVLFVAIIFIQVGFSFAKDIPEPSGWLNDFANVVSAEYREKINKLAQELEEKTSSEIAIVTVDSIAPYDEKDYGRLLFDSWKPGKKGKDNGVLVLLAITERRWRIEVGYGLEGILPDGLCGEIGRRHMVPYFKEARYGEGLYYGAAALAKEIARNANAALEALGGVGDLEIAEPFVIGPRFISLFLLVLFIIFLIAFINHYCYRNGTSRYGYFGGGFGGYSGGGGFGGGGFGGFGGGGGGGGGAGGGF